MPRNRVREPEEFRSSILPDPEKFWFGVAKTAVVSGVLLIGAINYESQHQGSSAPSSEEYFDASVPEQAVLSEAAIRGFVYDDLKRKALYAEERVFFDGSPETVTACKAAVVELAKVSIGPVMIDCTPSTTTTTAS